MKWIWINTSRHQKKCSPDLTLKMRQRKKNTISVYSPVRTLTMRVKLQKCNKKQISHKTMW